MKFDADKVRRLIAEAGYSILPFSEDVLGWNESTFRTILRRRSCKPSTLDEIAYALQVPMSELLPDDLGQIKVMLDEGAKITRAHDTDAGLDLYAMKSGNIPPCGYVKLDTGVHIAIPKNHVGLVTSKSSLMQQGITCRGTIDYGYTGSIKAVLFNHSHQFVRIEKGQKITQLVIMPIITPTPVLVDSLEETERGDKGFGSSGKF